MSDSPDGRTVGGEAGGRIHLDSPAFLLVALLVLAASAIIGVGASRYGAAVPALSATSAFPASIAVEPATAGLPWPEQGQAAVAMEGFGTLGVHNPSGQSQPAEQAIGSTAKVMTALLILEHHPLKPGESGPTVTLTQADVDRYNEAITEDQSVLQVQDGEKLTELDLLNGLLIPSANNFAEILARWDAGSKDAFLAQMNARAQALGMAHTHFDDSSGFSSKTVSTAGDLLLLEEAAMADPLFARIVSQSKGSVPVAGEIESTNDLLKEPGVIGVKTGETDGSGGCLMFAAKDSSGRTIYGVVLGQDGLSGAFAAAKALLAAAPAQVADTPVIGKGQPAATYSAAWGGSVPAVAAHDLAMPALAGSSVHVTVTLLDVKAPIAAGEKLGLLTASAGGRSESVDLVAAAALGSPGFGWRLTR
ncbi:MAG: D-alanyl-D-alanine carboxypeptidase family protein [Tepidiformaceae bacterium]